MPKDFVFISWNLGPESASRGKDLVRRWGIEREAYSRPSSLGSGYGSVRLRREDTRLRVVIRDLMARGMNPNPRLDREYTDRELDSAEYLHLIVATCGVEGSVNFAAQPRDRSRACRLCGAGAVPLEPLRIRTSKMGRKLMDSTSHDLRLIVPSEIASTLLRSGLCGFVPRAVCRPTGGAEERWKWIDIEHEWPPVDRPEFLYCAEPCATCGRAGHYSDWVRPTALVYDRFPLGSPDLGVSYEYFGRWYDRTPGDRPNGIAGGRVPIISQRAKRILAEYGVRHLAFEPVFSSGDPLLKNWPDGRLLEELSA